MPLVESDSGFFGHSIFGKEAIGVVVFIAWG